MILQLTLEKNGQIRPLEFEFTRMVNAGFVGRNQDEVQKHLKELSAKGVPVPSSTPVLYPVLCRALSQESAIEVFGSKTSGEVEYVLLIENEQNVYVALGSDHTDRHLEESDIPRAKQICPNIISNTVWSLDEVAEHWDEIVMQSRVVQGDQEIVYQEGRLELILSPAGLMDFVRSKIGGPLDKTIIYSGTVGMKTEEFLFGPRFEASLTDNVLNRRLDLAYDVLPLSYMSVEDA